jgi:two-component system NarL family sensor kinase
MVNNTLKHALASNVELRININPGTMELKYSDDGIGFDVEEKLESSSLGLKSIQSRVNFLSGKIDIDTKPGAGVKYKVQIPT